MLQDNLIKYNEANCVDKKPGVEHQSHRDDITCIPSDQGCTGSVQWQGTLTNLKALTLTNIPDEQDAVEADRKELDESKQMPAEAESTDPGWDTAS